MRLDRENIAKYYQHMQIDTASRQKQIVMLHDKLFQLVRDAIIEGTTGREERIRKAQNILAQLQIALNIDDEDELCHSLFLLYDYVYDRLDSDDITAYRDSLKVIETLRDTFAEQFKRK